MKKNSLLLLLLALLIVSITACGILQEPEAASGLIETVPLEEANVDADEAIESEESAAETVAAEPIIYQIAQFVSKARFELDEDLRGNRVTVVGLTDQVAGEISLDLNNLAATEVGVIQINARTLATDNNFRNRAIRNKILLTDEFEFITFTPTAVNGLPDSAAVGEEVMFTIDGDLMVKDITQPVTFELTVTVVSPEQLSGTATTTINRNDYGLSIPSVPNVANVEEEVELYIDFVANAT